MLLGCVFSLALCTHIQFFSFFRKKIKLNQQPEKQRQWQPANIHWARSLLRLSLFQQSQNHFLLLFSLLFSSLSPHLIYAFTIFSFLLFTSLCFSHSRDAGSFIFTEKGKKQKNEKYLLCCFKAKEKGNNSSSRKKSIKKKIHLNAFVCFLLHHRAALSYIRSNTSLAEVSANENFYLETLCHFQTTSPDISHIFTGDAWRSVRWNELWKYLHFLSQLWQNTQNTTHTAQRLHWWCLCTSHRFSIPPGSAEQES